MGVYIWNRLPSEYQEVEYIQSTGTQYIKIGTSFKTSYKTVIDFQMNVIGGDYIPIGINNYDGVNPTYRYGIDAYSSYFHVNAGGNWTSTKAEDTNRHTIIIDKSTAIVDGTSYTIGYSNYTYSSGICVFCYNEYNKSSPYNYKSSNKLYKLDIYDENGIHIYDLVPCYRKSDSVIGLYDLVNNQFYTNSGTGTFSKGNDVTMVEMKNAYIGEVWTPTSNTIAYWELNGNGDDTKNSYGIQTYTTTNYNSNGYVGAGNPTYTTTRNGKPCAYFDGTRALKFPTTIPIPSNTLTFSAWVKISANPSSAASIFQLREDISGNTSSTALEFLVQNGKLLPQWIATTSSTGKTGQTAYTTTGITYTLDTRYNIVATFNAGTLKFYVNGNLLDTATGNAWLRNNGETSSYIGGQYKSGWSVASYINGYVQDVIYENRVWSDTDVLNYYNKTK